MQKEDGLAESACPPAGMCAQVGAEQRGHLRHAGLPADAGAAAQRPQLHEPHGQRDAPRPGARLRHAAERRLLPGACAQPPPLDQTSSLDPPSANFSCCACLHGKCRPP